MATDRSRPDDDGRLIAVADGERGGAFLPAVLASAVLATLAWALLLGDFIAGKTPFAFTTTESNAAEAFRAVHMPAADVAIVGSSLSSVLVPGLFNRRRVVNLGLRGGSVLTGLELLAAAADPPRIVLAEVNILDRPADRDLIREGRAAARWVPLAILEGMSKPVRYLLSKPAFSADKGERPDDWRGRRASLLAQAPANYDVDAMVTAGLAEWDRRDDSDAAANWARLLELSDKLRSRGSIVYYLYLPYSPRLDAHPYAQRARELAGGTDKFTCAACIDGRRLVDPVDLRWFDGIHLDSRSAALVARALDRLLP